MNKPFSLSYIGIVVSFVSVLLGLLYSPADYLNEVCEDLCEEVGSSDRSEQMSVELEKQRKERHLHHLSHMMR